MKLHGVCEPDAKCDDFTGDKLGLQWQFNANMKIVGMILTGTGINLMQLMQLKQDL